MAKAVLLIRHEGLGAVDKEESNERSDLQGLHHGGRSCDCGAGSGWNEVMWMHDAENIKDLL